MHYSRDVSLWSQALTDTTFLVLNTIIFFVVIVVMTLFLSGGCFVNKQKIAFKYYSGTAIPSIAVAVLTQQVVFYMIFYDRTQQFFSLQSMFIPTAIAGVVHLLMTAILLRWYVKVTLKEGLKIGLISTIVPLVILMWLLWVGSNFAGMDSLQKAISFPRVSSVGLKNKIDGTKTVPYHNTFKHLPLLLHQKR